MKNVVTTTLILAAAATFSVGLGACGYRPEKYNIAVKQATSETVLIDLVAVPLAEVAPWETLNVDTYFSGNDKLRSDNVEYTRAYKFDGNAGRQELISSKDPIWTKWHKTRPVLFVVATSRSLKEQAATNPKARIYRVDMTNEYFRTTNFTVIVKDGGIQVDPPPTKK